VRKNQACQAWGLGSVFWRQIGARHAVAQVLCFLFHRCAMATSESAVLEAVGGAIGSCIAGAITYPLTTVRAHTVLQVEDSELSWGSWLAVGFAGSGGLIQTCMLHAA
jgi:hypothetical protein